MLHRIIGDLNAGELGKYVQHGDLKNAHDKAASIVAVVSKTRSASSTHAVRSDAHAMTTFVYSSAYKDAYVPGTIDMTERYMNLIAVINEATARFPETLSESR